MRCRCLVRLYNTWMTFSFFRQANRAGRLRPVVIEARRALALSLPLDFYGFSSTLRSLDVAGIGISCNGGFTYLSKTK
ncbi:unnamed protein product [Ciceribacter selenitireducens ATCC BAA-1503]|uniref:Uncharacterized protein n=1 Tax=Ciceribacter selenitireducens ATCC BAA-1503 TaxID=1336235 RepID=A0A376AFI5_9HYPH|nr:unnamed protein product [Ciceribacter selenitireducens ATCC BAA-1503]